MFENLKIFIIYYSFKLYHFFNLNIFLFIINYLGGPLFTKMLQTFFNLNDVNTNDTLSGSIGSVTIKKYLVIKNLHDNIDIKLENSLNILNIFLKNNKIPFPFYFNEFRDINKKQVNLDLEKNYSIELSQIFKNISNVQVIDIFFSNKNYHYSKLINGFRIDEFLIKYPQFKNEIFYNLYLSFYLMLSKNIFHCDWHFGNFLVNLDKNNQIVLYILDTGLMGKLDNKLHYEKMIDMFKINLLYLEPINIIKFLSFINLEPKATLSNFIKESKNINKLKINYSKKLILILKNATNNKLKFPIVILYMIQGIIFMEKFSINKDLKNLKIFSEKMGFTSEIVKTIT
tara:strand:+ start:1293 stop:2321 length:1029 start_codon:yes stop_codon:yes gene_type:complete